MDAQHEGMIQDYWTEEECNVFVKMVAFRNMISHQYVDIDAQVVYDVLQHRLGDVAKFTNSIAERMLSRGIAG